MAYKDIQKQRDWHRKWVAANPEKMRECKRRWNAANREKNRESAKRRREANPEKGRDYARRRKANSEKWKDTVLRWAHGITFQQFNALNIAQHGLCAICGNPPNGKKKWLSVDHDHTLPKGDPKRVRGLLCHSCNVALGLFKDNPVTLLRAVDYLSKS
jgi:hypothetical protein